MNGIAPNVHANGCALFTPRRAAQLPFHPHLATMKITCHPLAQRASLLMSFAFFGMVHWAAAQVTTSVDCVLMGLVVNVGSQENDISLYHPGGYLTSPPSENTMDWLFTDSEGNVIHEETLVNENFVSFNHSVPLTDTIFVSVLLTNDSAVLNGNPVACWIEDYLVWVEMEVIPGTFVGAWTLGGSVGQDVSETTGMTALDPAALELYPQPASDRLTLAGLPASGQLVFRDLAGQTVHLQQVTSPQLVLDLAALQPGMYVVQILNRAGAPLHARRMVVVR